MSVGLYDEDLMKYSPLPFNLEIMKLAAYYKKQKQIVILDDDLNHNKYGKYIIRKDYYDGEYLDIIMGEDNVEYGGLAFTGNVYEPLPIEIERCKGDTSIYERYRKHYVKNPITKTLFARFMKAEHLRLSLDGKTLWKDFFSQVKLTGNTRTVIIHDYDITALAETQDVIEELLTRNLKKLPRYIGVKFPIKVRNDEDLFRWLNFKTSSFLYNFEYSGVMPDEVLYEFIEAQKITNQGKNLEYYVTRGSETEEEFIELLPRLFRQICYIRQNRIKMTIKYDFGQFEDEKWSRFILFLSVYLRSASAIPKELFEMVIKRDTMYNFCREHLLDKKAQKNALIITKEEARDLFHFTREKSEQLFKYFYECKQVTYKGGKFEID